MSYSRSNFTDGSVDDINEEKQRSSSAFGKDNAAFSVQEFRRLVRSLSFAADAIPSENTLPYMAIAEVALAQPNQWIDAFVALNPDARYALLERLLADNSGPLGAMLVQVLGMYASEIDDELLQREVMDAVPVLLGRETARLERLAEIVTQDPASLRRDKAFNLQVQILEQETRLAQLRAEERSQDGEFLRLHQLEAEIRRLEAYLRAVEQYRPAEREQYRTSLEKKGATLEATRVSLERHINDQAERIRENDAALRSLERENVVAEERMRAQEITREQLVKRGAELTQALVEEQDLTRELAAHEAETQEAEARVRSLRQTLEQHRQALEIAPQADVIRAELEALLRRLPQDSADSSFTR
jgi:hypothetical protein